MEDWPSARPSISKDVGTCPQGILAFNLLFWPWMHVGGGRQDQTGVKGFETLICI